MYKTKKLRMLLAIGLLLITGSNLIDRFIIPINDFIKGFCIGTGIGLMIFALYRMKQVQSVKK